MLSGCVSYSYQREGLPIDDVAVKEIEAGVTSSKLILDMFGKPTRVIDNGEVKTMIYEYKEKRYPVYFGYTSESKAEVTKNVLEVKIKNDKVHSYRYKSLEY